MGHNFFKEIEYLDITNVNKYIFRYFDLKNVIFYFIFTPINYKQNLQYKYVFIVHNSSVVGSRKFINKYMK